MNSEQDTRVTKLFTFYLEQASRNEIRNNKEIGVVCIIAHRHARHFDSSN